MDSVKQDADAGKRESARGVVRRLGAAFRAVRMYSAGHGLTQQAIATALAAVEAFHRHHGVLRMVVLPEGIVFDFDPAPYEEELSSEFVRALRGGLVRGLHLLPGVAEEEVRTLIEVLHMPQPAVQHAGGAGVLLRQRGVQCVVVDDLVHEPPGRHAPIGATEDIVAAAKAGEPERVSALLEQVAGGNAAQIVRRLREMDAAIVELPRADQRKAWHSTAEAVRAMPPAVARDVMQAIQQAADEPWAASLAAAWPSADAAGLPPERTLPQVHLPDDLRAAARAELARSFGPPLTAHAARRLIDLLPVLDTGRFDEVVAMLEQQALPLTEQEADLATLTVLVTALSRLSAELPDARAELASVALHRIMSGIIRGPVLRALELPPPLPSDHPVLRVMRAATDESVRLLLELVADEDRRQVRREIVSLLPALAAGRLSLLVDHLVDPRWYIVRNVITVLAGVGTPEVVPYLRTGLDHADVRVRREALQALGQIEGPQADAVLTDALRHVDPETRALAARWLELRKQGS